jgi:hypothetical protein
MECPYDDCEGTVFYLEKTLKPKFDRRVNFIKYTEDLGFTDENNEALRLLCLNYCKYNFMRCASCGEWTYDIPR